MGRRTVSHRVCHRVDRTGMGRWDGLIALPRGTTIAGLMECCKATSDAQQTLERGEADAEGGTEARRG